MEKKSRSEKVKRTPGKTRAGAMKPAVGKATGGARRGAHRSKPSAKVGGTAAEDAGAPRAKTKCVRSYKKHAKKQISESFSGIVETLVELAREGSLGHTKLLFDIGGVKDEVSRRGRGRKALSLGTLLLEEMKKQQSACEAVAVTEYRNPQSSSRSGSLNEGVTDQQSGISGEGQA